MSCSEIITLNDYDKSVANDLENNEEVLKEFLEAHDLNDQFKSLLYFTETGQIDNVLCFKIIIYIVQKSYYND